MEESERIVTFTDDEGKEYKIEILDIIEHGDEIYACGVDAATPDDIDECEVLIMRVVHINDEEEALEPIEDEALLQEIFEIFKIHIDEEFEFEE